MDLSAQGFAHFSASDIGNGMQRQTVEQLIVVKEVLANTVDDEVQKLVLLVEKQGHGQISNLLLRVLVGRDEVHGLEVTKVDVPSQDVDVQEFADIFLLVVAAEAAVLELLSDVGKLLVDSLLLEFAGTGVSQIGNELDQTAHVRIAAAGAAQKAAGGRRHLG